MSTTQHHKRGSTSVQPAAPASTLAPLEVRARSASRGSRTQLADGAGGGRPLSATTPHSSVTAAPAASSTAATTLLVPLSQTTPSRVFPSTKRVPQQQPKSPPSPSKSPTEPSQQPMTMRDGLAAIVASLKRIVVSVVGDKKTGKSKLIESLKGCPFDSLTPTVVPIAEFAPGLTVVDTSCGAEDREDLVAKVSRSNVLLLLYSPDESESLQHVVEFWMPFLRSVADGEGRAPKPVVLVCAKDDLRRDVNDEQTVSRLMDTYPEIQGFLPVSVRDGGRNVVDVALYALQAVVYTQLGSLVQGHEERRAQEIQKQQEKWTAERQSLQAALTVATAEREALRATMVNETAHTSQETRSLEDRLSEVTARHDTDVLRAVQQAKADAASAMAASEERHRKQIQQLHAEADARLEDLRERMTRTLRAQTEDAQKARAIMELEREAVVKALQAQLVQARERAEKLQREQDEAQMRATLTADSSRMSMASLGSEAQRSERELKEMQEKLQEAQKTLQRRQVEYDRQLDIRKSLEARLEALQAKLDQAATSSRVEAANSVKQRELELTAAHQRELEEMSKKHAAELAASKAEYMREKDALLRSTHDADVRRTQQESDTAKLVQRTLETKDLEIANLREQLRAALRK